MSVVDKLILGGTEATASGDQARAYLRNVANRVLSEADIVAVVAAFVRWGGLVGIRWDVALAQSAHETNVYRFGGQVKVGQKNPAGIGATNDGVAGLTYPDWQTGIAAYFVHLLAWCDRLDLAPLITPTPLALDPRIPLVARERAKKGKATTWASLGGRWAVPGTGYGDGIARHHSAIMATIPGGKPMTLVIREALIPPLNSNRPGTPLTGGRPTFLTLHETGNPRVGANARMHRNFSHGGEYPGYGGGGYPAGMYDGVWKEEYEGVSFHYTVDDNVAYQLLPDWEKGYHAGDGLGPTSGGSTSIGVEICINQDGNWQKTLVNAAQLAAIMIIKHQIPLKNVVMHRHWSGKNCPTTIIRDGLWAGLIAAISTLSKVGPPTPPPPPPPPALPPSPAIFLLQRLLTP